ncbi:MAG: hypothetical protein Q8L88_10630 [Bacteroidota bacterium]|nr:hypothetical protein [Bacteroidota bacterium]
MLRVIKIAALDTSDMPWFAHSMRSFEDTTTSAIIDVGLLGFFSLAAFICAFVRFLWYDVR